MIYRYIAIVNEKEKCPWRLWYFPTVLHIVDGKGKINRYYIGWYALLTRNKVSGRGSIWW